MKKDEMDTLNNLLLEARKKINTNDVKYDKNGVPCSVTVDKGLHKQRVSFTKWSTNSL